MGWKSVKDHYNIEHIVQVTEKGICIGSAYIPNLIVVSDYIPKWGSELGVCNERTFARYYAEMHSDLIKLKELIDAKDVFEKSLTVFTYEGAEIIEDACEELDWPNITHSGRLMYENYFSTDRNEVLKMAKSNAEAKIENFSGQIDDMKKELQKREERLNESKDDLKKIDMQIANHVKESEV